MVISEKEQGHSNTGYNYARRKKKKNRVQDKINFIKGNLVELKFEVKNFSRNGSTYITYPLILLA